MSGDELLPTEFCERQRQRFVGISTPEGRKKHGQFFTPPEVARFMAGLAPTRSKRLRLLDPGAGAGMLTCAVCERGAEGKNLKEVHVDAYEDDVRLVELLKESLEFTNKWLERSKIEFNYRIISEDFVFANARTLWNVPSSNYDLAISNPPYFKIGKNDPRAQVNLEMVYGQPNIYALFMGLAAELVREKGALIFITPRSYAAGPYFKAFRKRFFKMMRPEKVHIFESRKDAFRSDEVLQENVILFARKRGSSGCVGISVSEGLTDLRRAKIYRVPVSRALHNVDKKDVIFRLPINDEEKGVLETVDSWPGSLHKYGWEISTGPVVPFRARSLIPEERGEYKDAVPLLWMRHVQPMKVNWPLSGKNNGKEKQQHIMDSPLSRKRRLLVKNTNLVLLRRFSAKEEVRRLIAAPLLEYQLPYGLIGIENHLNYIYRLQGELAEEEAIGLASLLNSSLLDRYFRISNGNTQVSATELRAMPLPPLKALSELGSRIKERCRVPTLEEIDALVKEVLRV
jgi:adenine-specific DNA-methyltransferase